MDERELRQLFHAAFDRVQPLRDPFRRVRESSDQRRAQWGYAIAGGLAGLMAVFALVALLLLRHLTSAPSAGMAYHPVTGETAPVVLRPVEVAQVANVVSERPTPRVAALSDQVALVSVGDSILRASDAGRTWRTVYPGRHDHAGNVRDLEWVSRDIAFAASNYGLLRSDDGGKSWRLVNARPDLRRLDFVSGSEGYVVAGTDAQASDWHLLRTDDGGAAFTAYPVGLLPVTWVQWVSDTHAWAAGPEGVVATTDGGEHWQAQLTFGKGVFSDAQVGFVDAGHGFAYLRSAAGQSAQTVYQTSDGGRHWRGVGAPDTRSGLQDDQLAVTGPSSAEIVTRSEAEGVVRCALSGSGDGWKCLLQPLTAEAGAREVARGPFRLMTALRGDQVVIAASSDGGTTWSTVEVDASAWTRR